MEKCAQAMKTLDNSKQTGACSMDDDTEWPVESLGAILFKAEFCLLSNILDSAMTTVFPVE